MKKAGRRFHRIFRAVFAAALALAITGANLAPAAAVTWADVNELKDEANGLDAEKRSSRPSWMPWRTTRARLWPGKSC